MLAVANRFTMIYDNELVHYKNTNFDHPKGLQTFTPAPAPATSSKQDEKLQRVLQQGQFCRNSVHGVLYLWETDSRPRVRLFWLFTVIAAIISCGVMYHILYSHHNKQQIKTVVETSQLPLYTVKFPSVAICPWNHINWLRFKAATERFLPLSPNEDIKQLFHDLLVALEDMTLIRLESLNMLEKHTTLFQVVESINIYDLLNFMAFRCDELFVSCIYDETTYDCCKIFVAEPTEKGICMVFNSMISEESQIKQLTDKYYPWKIRKSGEGSGLIVTLRYNQTYYRPESKILFGLNVMIKESDEWSDSNYYNMYPNTHNYLSVTPLITETSKNTRVMPPEKRRCLFEDEHSSKYERIDRLPYNKLNCYAQCQHKNIIKMCNCTLPWFFPKQGDKFDICKVSDLQCIHKHRDIFSYIKHPSQDDYIIDTRRGVICDCVDSCLSMVFLITANTNLIPNSNNSVPLIIGDIFIGQSVLTKYGARLEYTLLDLLANFGGILGLSLGASVLSLAELFYATIKIIAVVIVSKKLNWRIVNPMNVVKYLQKKFN